MKESQCKQILDYLQTHRGITAWDAMEKLHIMRLASRIHDLRERGYDIIGEMIETESGKRYMRYRLEVSA